MMTYPSASLPPGRLGQESVGTNPLRPAVIFLVTNPQLETSYRWQTLSHYHTQTHFHFEDFQGF